MILKIRDSSLSLLEVIREIDSKFQLKNLQYTKEGPNIREAYKKQVEKILGYLNYQDKEEPKSTH